MKIGICQELFQDWPLDRVLPYIKELGYRGLELAPFKFADSVADIPPETRAAIRRSAEKQGIEIIGTHWLLVKPAGLSLSDPDPEIRRRTSDYFAQLVAFTHDTGGTVMVLGSPKQRRLADGQTYEKVKGYFKDILRAPLDLAAARNVVICLEPLSRLETNFVTGAQEALAIIHEINHPNLKLILDVKAMSYEDRPLPDIIREGAPCLRHVHVNDPNLRGPGSGAVDYAPIMAALREIDYRLWLSVEVFDFSPGPEAIAQSSIDYLRKFI